jgi:hypothetical protein
MKEIKAYLKNTELIVKDIIRGKLRSHLTSRTCKTTKI